MPEASLSAVASPEPKRQSSFSQLIQVLISQVKSDSSSPVHCNKQGSKYILRNHISKSVEEDL